MRRSRDLTRRDCERAVPTEFQIDANMKGRAGTETFRCVEATAQPFGEGQCPVRQNFRGADCGIICLLQAFGFSLGGEDNADGCDANHLH